MELDSQKAHLMCYNIYAVTYLQSYPLSCCITFTITRGFIYVFIILYTPAEKPLSWVSLFATEMDHFHLPLENIICFGEITSKFIYRIKSSRHYPHRVKSSGDHEQQREAGEDFGTHSDTGPRRNRLAPLEDPSGVLSLFRCLQRRFFQGTGRQQRREIHASLLQQKDASVAIQRDPAKDFRTRGSGEERGAGGGGGYLVSSP